MSASTPSLEFIQNGTLCYVRHNLYDYHNVPSFYPTLNLALFYTYLSYVIITLGWMKMNMNVYPLSKRDFYLVALSSVGGLLLWSFFIREAYGRETYDCDTYLWTSQLVLPLLNGPIIVRLVLVYNKNASGNKMKGMSFQRIAAAAAKLRRQQQLRDHNIFSYMRLLFGYVIRYGRYAFGRRNTSKSVPVKSPRKTDEIMPRSSDITPPRGAGELDTEPGVTLTDSDRTLFARFGTSKIFAALACFAFISPFVLSILIRSLTSPQYGHGCVGCDLISVDFFLFVGSLVILLGGCIYAFWRAKQFDDPLGIMAEIRQLAYFGFGTSVPGLLLKLVDPGKLEARGMITWTYITAVTTFSLHTIQCTWQVIKLYTKKAKDYEMTLSDVLEDPALREDFAQFLIAEFSFENLRFIDQVAEWKTRFNALPRFEREKMAYEIYFTFIPEESFLQVNLKSKNRVDLDNIFEGRQFEDRNTLVDPPLTQDLYDAAAAEIFKMMEKDSFPRFMDRRAVARSSRKTRDTSSILKDSSFRKESSILGISQTITR